MSLCYLNGQYQELEKASISPLDRGFIFGDGVYEVIPVYNNSLFCTQEHLDRLQRSMESIKMTCGLKPVQWHEIFTNLLATNQASHCYIYLQVTRGGGLLRHHTIPDKIEPTLFVYVNPLSNDYANNIRHGLSVITMEDNRAAICHIKATTLLPNVLCLEQARAQGAQETILVKDNYVTEAASSNVFMVSNNIIRTTPTTANILSGITRKIVIQLARNNGIVVEECNFTVDELLRAEEIWLTSSTREIAPVIKINQLAVGDARPGPLWQRIDELFQQYKIN